jgi:hypothetical protein
LNKRKAIQPHTAAVRAESGIVSVLNPDAGSGSLPEFEILSMLATSPD